MSTLLYNTCKEARNGNDSLMKRACRPRTGRDTLRKLLGQTGLLINQQEAISREKLCNILPGIQNMPKDKSCSNISQVDYNRMYKQKQTSSKTHKQKEMLNKQQVRSNKEYSRKWSVSPRVYYHLLPTL